jgi:hypothetical protein
MKGMRSRLLATTFMLGAFAAGTAAQAQTTPSTGDVADVTTAPAAQSADGGEVVVRVLPAVRCRPQRRWP